MCDLLFIQTPLTPFFSSLNFLIIPYFLKLATFLSYKGKKVCYYNPFIREKKNIFQYTRNFKKNLELNSIFKRINRVIEKTSPKALVLLTFSETQAPLVVSLLKTFKHKVNKIYVFSKFFKRKFLEEGAWGVIDSFSPKVLKSIMEFKRGVFGCSDNCLHEDWLPKPDWELVMDIKKCLPNFFSMISVGGGCPFRCNFCMSSKNFWRRNPLDVVSEILDVINKFGTREFSFEVPSFPFPKKWAQKLCELLKKKCSNIVWHTHANTIHLSKEILTSMRKAGCISVAVGFESGSERMLRLMRKPQNLRIMQKVIKNSKESGISILGSFLIGFPGEKMEDVHKTLSFIRKANLDSFVLDIVKPRIGTQLFASLSPRQKRIIKETVFKKGYYPLVHLGNKKEILEKIVKTYSKFSERKNKIFIRRLFLRKNYLLAKSLQMSRSKNLINMLRLTSLN